LALDLVEILERSIEFKGNREEKILH